MFSSLSKIPTPQRARIYVIEANPRALRNLAIRGQSDWRSSCQNCCAHHDGSNFGRASSRRFGQTTELGLSKALKEAVLPFDRFDADTILGPEMRSTGEVMGVDRTFGLAFAKSQISSFAESSR